MTSVADSDLSTGGDLSLREASASADAAPARVSQNFNLRAYLAGGAATTALIAGAIFVFASLAAYVAFNGFPIGANDENASQLTVAAGGSTAPEAAAAVLGGAPGAVAPTAAASTATAPGSGGSQTDAGSGGGSNPGSPNGSPGDPSTPPGTTPTPIAEVPPASAGPVSGAVDDVSNATNLPLSETAGGAAGQVDDALNGIGGPNSGQQLGDAVNGTVGGATQAVGDLLGQ